ncbi:hypothetical protein H0266_15700 [Halobacillus locisalis]|uniref:Polysaccharide chain length determinant N-terminal domain-containing protein n=1 Tax=Halobacillus locisalis TaxID=220753 RepID=A0A838CWQ0_9BACI|nr:Wzz/FepE/Etk N-terminal domain-containing protein [Halobacillus locisalis]MBA2176341.1 hypothetical protein [Halobacillus locisalis]
MNEKMDVKRFMTVVKRRFLTILLVTMTLSLITAAVSVYVLKPTYEVTHNLVIGKLNKDDSTYGENRELNMLLASTIDFIQSPSVLSSVREDFAIPYEELSEMIVVRNTQDSQIVNVTVRSSHPDEAEKMAEIIVRTTVTQMNELFDVNDIVILDDPTGEGQVQQVGSILINIGIGVVVSVLAGIGIAMLREHMDDSVEGARELEEQVGVPVLGVVDMKKRKRTIKKHQLKTEIEEELSVKERRKRGEVRV